MTPLKQSQILESKIQQKTVRELVCDAWYCVSTHGNAYQSGFPDLFLCSKRFGTKWVEIKRPDKYKFTQAQLNVFTQFSAKKIGIWILTGESQHERNKLFNPPNWHTFLYSSSGITLDKVIKRIPKSGPEAIIQDGIIAKITKVCACNNSACQKHPLNNWFALETYGSIYQSGLPDIYACHARYGQRWIECKNPARYVFTPAQHRVFPELTAYGVNIHILTADTDYELNKIFGPANWHQFLWKSL